MAGPAALVLEGDGALTDQRPYGAILSDDLSAVGWDVAVTPVADPWPDLARYELVVISGGTTSVSATRGWMPRRLADLRVALEHAPGSGTRLLGVCLGSQMIAAALAGPGAIHTAPRMSAGIVQIKLGDGGSRYVPAFNFEEVDPEALTRAGADVLATAESGAVAAFRWGTEVLGVAFHPELRAGVLEEVMSCHRGVLTEHHLDPDAVLSSIAEHRASIPDGGWPVVEEIWPEFEILTDRRDRSS